MSVRALAVAALLWTGAVTTAEAAELVFFHRGGCDWCEAWRQDVGTVYPKTEEGRLLPLREVDLGDQRPADLTQIEGVTFSPTFVVVADDGSEVGRILGYPGEELFWWQLSALVNRLENETPPSH